MIYDIVIIGAGTAGLSAGIYGVRAGKKVLILEEKYYGGQIINTPHIANYPGIKNISGFEFATNLYEQAIELGVEIQYEKVIKIEDNNKIKKVITEENSYDCKSIIIATGAKNRKLGVENEEKFTGAGVSYCATCDGAFFRGKDVAVVGGGNTALEDAGFLAEYCNKVYLIHRRDEFRGEDKLVNILKEKSNVEFILNSTVSAIEGSDIVEGITVKNIISNEIRSIDVNGIFIAIGQAPDNAIFSEIINLDEKGYVIADETCKTNLEGIFTAGDCRTKKIRQLTTAASDGSVAALAACEWCGTN